MQSSIQARPFSLVAVVFIGLSILGAAYVLGRVPDKSSPQPTPVATGTAISADAFGVDAKVASADASKGPQLFNQYGCYACHGTPGGVAPYVIGLGKRAATRRPGYSAAAYIYESITDPGAFTVPDYPAWLMPKNFKATIPADQIYDLVAWLLTQ